MSGENTRGRSTTFLLRQAWGKTGSLSRPPDVSVNEAKAPLGNRWRVAAETRHKPPAERRRCLTGVYSVTQLAMVAVAGGEMVRAWAKKLVSRCTNLFARVDTINWIPTKLLANRLDHIG